MNLRLIQPKKRPMRNFCIGASVCLLLGVFIWSMTLSKSKEASETATITSLPVNTEIELKPAPPAAPPQSKQIIVLDAGHGMANIYNKLWDPGVTSGKTYESVIVLNQAKVIKKLLEEKGYKVHLTRKDEKSACCLKERISIAEKFKPTILVSLHCNGFSSSKVYGQETIYWNEKSKVLAGILLDELVAHLKKNKQQVRKRSVLKKRLMLVKSSITSVIIEAGFLSNPIDKKMLTNEKHIAAQGITNGIDKYLTSLREIDNPKILVPIQTGKNSRQ